MCLLQEGCLAVNFTRLRPHRDSPHTRQKRQEIIIRKRILRRRENNALIDMPCGATYLRSVTLSMMKPYDTSNGFSKLMRDCKAEAPMDGELQIMEVLLSTVQFYKQT